MRTKIRAALGPGLATMREHPFHAGFVVVLMALVASGVADAPTTMMALAMVVFLGLGVACYFGVEYVLALAQSTNRGTAEMLSAMKSRLNEQGWIDASRLDERTRAVLRIAVQAHIDQGPTTPQPPPEGGYGDVAEDLQAFLIAGGLDVVADEELSVPYGAQLATLSALIGKRRAFGLEKYGRPLAYNDGRDPVEDALEEALDGIVYAYKGWRQGADLAPLRQPVAALLAMVRMDPVDEEVSDED